ncbi:MAG: ferritin-like domain-containing protein [Myxococcales bacterium]|nr:ferritin-like domain-containing protein [Myxococcales bacterium]
MDVRQALLLALATVPLGGCPSTWNCHPDEEDFSVDEAVSAAEIDEIIAAGYTDQVSWETVKCETVCDVVYNRVRGWQTAEIETCSLTLPENPDGTGAPGKVVCDGLGIEYYCKGRRPLGHVDRGDEDCSDALGRSLAAMAYLEAASVLAFEELAEQLRGWGGPEALIERCLAAAADERVHAEMMTALAEEQGARVPVVEEARSEPADRLAVALHNAVEGCVHETFSALLAACYARRAHSPALRRAFARLADDETRHGQLAWDLHEWLRGQLEEDDRRMVDAARSRALDDLRERGRVLAALPIELGPPTPAQGEALATAFAAALAA